MNAPVEKPVSYDRHCEETGTYLEAAVLALAPNADFNDAPDIVIDALEQLSTDLFMLSAALSDGTTLTPIKGHLVHQAISGLRGRVDALQKFAEHKLVVRWRYDDENEAEIAEKSGLKSELRQ